MTPLLPVQDEVLKSIFSEGFPRWSKEVSSIALGGQRPGYVGGLEVAKNANMEKIQMQISEMDKGGQQREDRGQARLEVWRWPESPGQRLRQLINTPGRPTAQSFTVSYYIS